MAASTPPDADARKGAQGVEAGKPASASPSGVTPPGKEKREGDTAGPAPLPVISGSDRVGGAAPSGTGKTAPTGKPAKPATAPDAAAAAAPPRQQPYRPAQPKSDWDASKNATRPAGPSSLRALLFGAAGGAIAAILLLAVWGPGSARNELAATNEGDGKIATALEEIEKDRAAGAARNSELQALEKNSADLNARLSALEQKSPPAGAPDADLAERIVTLERKLATIEASRQALSASGQVAAPERDETALAGLTQRMDALERRLDQSNQGHIAGREPEPVAPPPAASQTPNDGFPPPAPPPEAKRPTGRIPGWVLHSVDGGVAVLEGRNTGIVELRRGQSAPGLGRVSAIERRGNRWIVTTDRGVISAPAY